MATDQKIQYRNLIKKYRIHFDGPASDNEWPERHRKTFADIRKLGRTEFQQYQESISVDSDIHPWREQTKCRAERIASLAGICRKGRRNEAGWRLLLESEILVRFTVEVACRRCRARLWRSELEASLSEQNEFADQLVERQKGRMPCKCSSLKWTQEPQEQGVSLLFEDRAEEHLIHSPQVMADLPKKSEQPDRVYGLRMTKRLERLLLWSEDKRPSAGGKPIGESIRSSPFRTDGDPVVFPFLVLEAKSEKGKDAFSDIEIQTAFSIRTLLELQHGLRSAVGEASEFAISPLVWFLSYKGEQWRVSAGYSEVKDGRESYRIVDLWDGRITSKEGALCLLLIVDYIFDWARDVYRETIISGLRYLSSSDTPSMANDSDVFSMLDRINFHELDIRSESQDEIHQPVNEVPATMADDFRKFDSTRGVIRDAKYIRSRFISLYITEDNLSLFLKSMRTAQHAQSAARTILRFLKDCWRVDREALDQLEHMWTGVDRENENIYRPDKPFLVMVTLSTFISPDWEQTRELTLLAISAGTVETLMQHANQKVDDEWGPSQLPYVGTPFFVGFLQAYRHMSIQDNLLAAISRACVSSKLYAEESSKKKSPDHPAAIWVFSKEETDDGDHYRFDAAIVPDQHAHAREFIISIYNVHKIGRNEPSSSMLRISSRIDEQKLEGQTMESVWPTSELDIQRLEKLVAVTSKNPSNITTYPELCVFALDEISKTTILEAGETELIPRRFMQTRRLDTKPGWGRGWNHINLDYKGEDLSMRVFELIGYVRETAHPTHPHGSELNDESGTKRSWKPKATNGHWTMIMPHPVGLPELLSFKRTVESRGKRVTSITQPWPRGALRSKNSDGQPRKSKTLKSRKGKEKAVEGEASLQEVNGDEMSLDIEALDIPERPPTVLGFGMSSAPPNSPARVSTHHRRQDVEDMVTARSPKRTLESIVIEHDDDDGKEKEGEASSSRLAGKRRRIDPVDVEMVGDYLDEDEFDRLLANGYFT